MTRPQFTPRSHRAQQILGVVGRAYPAAWSQMDTVRALRGRDLPAWPTWCYAPLHAAEAIVSAVHDPGPPPRRVPFDRVHHIGIVGALAAWRMGQGVYRYDPELAAALDETPMPSDLPVSVLYRLPEWCVYLETPGLWSVDGRPLAGVWVHLEWDEHGADELRLLLDLDRPVEQALGPDGLIPVPLILGPGAIGDALARVAASGALQAEAHGLRAAPALLDAAPLASRIWPIVSRVLYLCAEAPDLGGQSPPHRPQPVRTKDGWRLFPAPGLRRWEVGVRIGAAIRAAREAEAHEVREALASGRARPRPHVRRAHFHGHWTGPRDPARAEDRRLVVRWQAPVSVNVDDPADLPVTIHNVDEGTGHNGGSHG